MSVYFMQPVEGGPIKIGFSKNVENRRQTLQYEFGRKLEVLGIVDGGREMEAKIHKQFAHLRLGKTEQFKPAADLMEFIGKPILVNVNPDAVEAMPFVCNPQFNFRLTDEATANIALIREHNCLPSDTSAILVALKREAERIQASKPPPRKPAVRQASRS